MATLSTGDTEKTIAITLTDASLSVEDNPITDLFNSLDVSNMLVSIDTVIYATGTSTILLKDARSYAVTVNPGNPPTFKFVSASFWLLTEIATLRALSEAIMRLVISHGMSAMTVTFS